MWFVSSRRVMLRLVFTDVEISFLPWKKWLTVCKFVLFTSADDLRTATVSAVWLSKISSKKLNFFVSYFMTSNPVQTNVFIHVDLRVLSWLITAVCLLSTATLRAQTVLILFVCLPPTTTRLDEKVEFVSCRWIRSIWHNTTR